ncbi:hypothetical protein N403_06910 [Helicobacter pylori FD430]|nr:hypothetical protein N403_06910 [Helicobacter pylori FD430]
MGVCVFLLKCVKKMRLRQEAKMKNIYFDVEKASKISKIFLKTLMIKMKD